MWRTYGVADTEESVGREAEHYDTRQMHLWLVVMREGWRP